MEPKPLSKERREEILREFQSGPYESKRALMDVLAAEQFWREAVKKAPGVVHQGIHDWREYCAFCDADDEAPGPVVHRPDCAWLLAQEEG